MINNYGHKINLQAIMQRGVNMKRKILKNTLLIITGSTMYAFALSLFLTPNKIAPGGVSGISIMANHLTGIGVGVFLFLINIPLLIIGLIKLGKSFFFGTMVTILLSSILTDLFAKLPSLTKNTMLSALGGGVSLAVAIGLIFKAGYTTGGTDIIVRLIKLRHKHLKTGIIFIAVDGIISILSGIVFQNPDYALYALLSLVTSSIVLDIVLYGSDEARLVYIITKKEKEISDYILKKLDIGCTLLESQGAYSKEKRQTVMCAIKKRDLPQLQEYILQTDRDSFMIVTSANEIYGEGYKLRMNNY